MSCVSSRTDVVGGDGSGFGTKGKAVVLEGPWENQDVGSVSWT